MTIDPELKKRFEDFAAGLDRFETVASYEDMAGTARFLLAELERIKAMHTVKNEGRGGDAGYTILNRWYPFYDDTKKVIESFLALCTEAQK